MQLVEIAFLVPPTSRFSVVTISAEGFLENEKGPARSLLSDSNLVHDFSWSREKELSSFWLIVPAPAFSRNLDPAAQSRPELEPNMVFRYFSSISNLPPKGSSLRRTLSGIFSLCTLFLSFV